jgi:hypothetical protein
MSMNIVWSIWYHTKQIATEFLMMRSKKKILRRANLIDFQIITLSASANKLSKIKERAEEYTALIMEELDPDGLGYIEV